MSIALGILHPGEMGSFLAASARNTLGTVYWCPEGRSAATRTRAEQQGLTEISSLEEFCRRCSIIVSVCPPHAADAQADAVVAAQFKGIYVDANALSPATMQSLGARLQTSGLRVVDGGIIGLASYKPGTTWLYLSGPDAAEVAACFSAGPIEVSVLGTELGQASALKMCFAAWNKGKNALLSAVLATADDLGVRAALEQQWDIYEPGFSTASTERLCGIARKAWRFGGEMDEIAETLQASGVPHEFFTAAAELYRRESAFKDSTTPPSLEQLLAAVRTPRA
jgi:3-hydroxyisobutyrate dehydrogenase-like beta-hydroxyacid dehydrogenase